MAEGSNSGISKREVENFGFLFVLLGLALFVFGIKLDIQWLLDQWIVLKAPGVIMISFVIAGGIFLLRARKMRVETDERSRVVR